MNLAMPCIRKSAGGAVSSTNHARWWLDFFLVTFPPNPSRISLFVVVAFPLSCHTHRSTRRDPKMTSHVRLASPAPTNVSGPLTTRPTAPTERLVPVTDFRRIRMLNDHQGANSSSEVWLGLDDCRRTVVIKCIVSAHQSCAAGIAGGGVGQGKGGGTTTSAIAGPPRRTNEVEVQFENEVAIMRHLGRSKHVVHYRGCAKSNGFYMIIMDYVEAGCLNKIISTTPGGGGTDDAEGGGSFGPASLGIMRSVAKQLLKAIRSVHSRGVIHRDIKPGNVLVRNSLQVVLADFGLAIFERDNEENTNWSRRLYGTPPYMAPEICAQNHPSKPYSRASDIWAFGVTMLELRLGRNPFFDPNPNVVTRRILDFKGLRALVPAIAGSYCETFLSRCLVKDPRDRATVDDLLKDTFIVLDCPDESPTAELRHRPRGGNGRDGGGGATTTTTRLGRSVVPPTAGWSTTTPSAVAANYDDALKAATAQQAEAAAASTHPAAGGVKSSQRRRHGRHFFDFRERVNKVASMARGNLDIDTTAASRRHPMDEMRAVAQEGRDALQDPALEVASCALGVAQGPLALGDRRWQASKKKHGVAQAAGTSSSSSAMPTPVIGQTLVGEMGTMAPDTGGDDVEDDDVADWTSEEWGPSMKWGHKMILGFLAFGVLCLVIALIALIVQRNAAISAAPPTTTAASSLSSG